MVDSKDQQQSGPLCSQPCFNPEKAQKEVITDIPKDTIHQEEHLKISTSLRFYQFKCALYLINIAQGPRRENYRFLGKVFIF